MGRKTEVTVRVTFVRTCKGESCIKEMSNLVQAALVLDLERTGDVIATGSWVTRGFSVPVDALSVVNFGAKVARLKSPQGQVVPFHPAEESVLTIQFEAPAESLE